MDMRHHDSDKRQLKEALLPTTARQNNVTTSAGSIPPSATGTGSSGIGGGVGVGGSSSGGGDKHKRRNSLTLAIAKQHSRPRIGQFRKQKRDWSTWTGRVSVHLPVTEFQINLLARSWNLSGWQWDELFDVMRVWQVEPPYIGHDVFTDFPPIGTSQKTAAAAAAATDNNKQQKAPPSPPRQQQEELAYSTLSPKTASHAIGAIGGEGNGEPPQTPITGSGNNVVGTTRTATTTGTTDMMAVLPEVYIFSFGAVVFWNFPSNDAEMKWMQEHLLTTQLEECYGDEYSKEETEAAKDDMGFKFCTTAASSSSSSTGTKLAIPSSPPGTPNRPRRVAVSGETSDPSTTTSTSMIQTSTTTTATAAAIPKFTLQRDVATLTTREFGERLAISFAIAKSSLLSVYEYRVQQTIERNSHIPEELARKGCIQMSRREIAQEVGRMFLVKHGINLDNQLIDTPEELWTDDRFEGTYETTLRYFELSKRLELVNNRLDMIGELHQVLTEQTENRHGVALEWIIIVLIVAEVLLEIVQIYFNR